MTEHLAWLDAATKLDPQGEPHRTGNVAVETTSIADHAALFEHLRRHPAAGWICFTSAVLPYTDRVEWLDDSPHGFVLSAELALREVPEKSWHVRQSRDGWTVTTFIESIGQGPMVARDTCLLSTEPGWRLRYRNWWHLVPGDLGVRVWTPYLARFVGWERTL